MEINLTPRLLYHTAFDENEQVALFEGAEYEIICAFVHEDVYTYEVMDEEGIVNVFIDDGEWFSEHFYVYGNVFSIMERID